MFKAIIFDFGGVILNQPKAVIPEVIARIYNISLEEAIKEYSKYRIDYYLGKIPTDKLIVSLSLVFESNKSVEEIKKLWLRNYANLAKADQEVLGIIKNLHKKYKVYLLSNTTEMSHLHNSKTGIYDYFDDVFLSYRLGAKKPNPEIYRHVISSIGLRPEECIFVDDDEKNLQTAEQLGIIPILFNILIDPPVKLKKELKKLNLD